MAGDQDGVGVQQLHSVLVRRIKDGEYPDGARLPTETELAQEFGCGTDIAARALRLLQWNGLARKAFRNGYLSTGPKTRP